MKQRRRIEVPAKTSKVALNRLIQNPKRIVDEDEADYQFSMAAIRQGGKDIPLSIILKRYGRR